MGRKKKPQMEDKSEQVVVVRVNAEVNQLFRKVCMLREIKAKDQIDKLLRDWAEDAIKKHGLVIPKVG